MANILLVDDRPQNLLALEAILEPLGQTLVKAGSGEQALRRLARGIAEAPDCQCGEQRRSERMTPEAD